MCLAGKELGNKLLIAGFTSVSPADGSHWLNHLENRGEGALGDIAHKH